VDPSRIPEAILDAVGLPASPEMAPLDQVVAFLERQPCLLLLDNYEHLVERGGAVVRRLLERTPALTCLVTSRRRLDLDGEREFPVRPLPVPERLLLPPEDQRQPRPVGRRSPAEEPTALPEWLVQCPSIQLLVDRAQAVAPDFQVTPGTAGAVAELCRRLEGVPLALELAAARVSVMTPAHIVARLDHCLDLLVRQRRDVSPRHRSLRATLDWSYQLLAPELRRFLARLSVFRGGWTLEAAEVICEEPLALDYLEQLRECSLILAEPEGGDPALAMPGMRYRMLETLREYGWEQLEAAGELPAVRSRHRDWYLQLAEQADAAASQPELMPKGWVTRLEAELDNLRAALAWCQEEAEANPAGNGAEAGLRLAGSLAWLWYSRGYLTEGLHWLEGMLTRGSHLPAAVRAPALYRAAQLAGGRGDPERSRMFLQAARREYEQLLTLARREGNRSDVAHTLQAIAFVATQEEDLEAAWSYCVEARQLFAELGEPVGLARTLGWMAGIPLERGDLRAARPLLEERLAICRKLGDPGLLVHALGGMGHLERDEGDYARAQALYRESLLLRRELGALFALAQSLEDLAVLAGRQGEAERAIRLLGAAEAFCETLGAHPPVAIRAEYERTVRQGRAVLGEAVFAATWAEGRSMSLEQAIDYALEEPLGHAPPT
jgi:non-specific serine/threonine protein kinase